jgi:hypothetical protein
MGDRKSRPELPQSSCKCELSLSSFLEAVVDFNENSSLKNDGIITVDKTPHQLVLGDIQIDLQRCSPKASLPITFDSDRLLQIMLDINLEQDVVFLYLPEFRHEPLKLKQETDKGKLEVYLYGRIYENDLELEYTNMYFYDNVVLYKHLYLPYDFSRVIRAIKDPTKDLDSAQLILLEAINMTEFIVSEANLADKIKRKLQGCIVQAKKVFDTSYEASALYQEASNLVAEVSFFFKKNGFCYQIEFFFK